IKSYERDLVEMQTNLKT
ncbi:hypothetical protein HNY73_011610, partial [Argiope bruennichi]